MFDRPVDEEQDDEILQRLDDQLDAFERLQETVSDMLEEVRELKSLVEAL